MEEINTGLITFDRIYSVESGNSVLFFIFIFWKMKDIYEGKLLFDPV